MRHAVIDARAGANHRTPGPTVGCDGGEDFFKKVLRRSAILAPMMADLDEMDGFEHT